MKQIIVKSEGEFPHFAVLETSRLTLRESAVQVLQDPVVRNDKDSFSLQPCSVLFHQLQGPQTAIEAPIATLQRNWEDVAEDAHVAQSVALLPQNVLSVIWIYLGVLPFLLVPYQSLLLLKEPFHLAEVESPEPASFLFNGAAEVANFREDFCEFWQDDHVLYLQPVGFDEQFSSFQRTGEGRDEENVYLAIVLDVGGREVRALCLENSLLAERAVDQPHVVVEVATQWLLKGCMRNVDVFVEL